MYLKKDLSNDRDKEKDDHKLTSSIIQGKHSKTTVSDGTQGQECSSHWSIQRKSEGMPWCITTWSKYYANDHWWFNSRDTKIRFSLKIHLVPAVTSFSREPQDQSSQKCPISYTNTCKSKILLKKLQKSKVLDYTTCKGNKSMGKIHVRHMAGEKIKRRICLVFHLWESALRSVAR